MELTYKSEEHKNQCNQILQKLGLITVNQNRELGSFAYIASATYKTRYLLPALRSNGSIDVEMYYDAIEPFSSSEKAMLKFAIQCFNDSISDITIPAVFRSLDSENTFAVKQAINIRY